MNIQKIKVTALALCVLIALVVPASFANYGVKTARPAAKCKSIFAVQQDVLVTTGCTSPIGFCAGGTFRGNNGFRGTSFFSATSFDPIPSDSLGRLVVPGTSTYTTDDGVLTIDDVSAFDAARGTFAGIGRIVSGTGRFAGATGDIFTTGRSPDGTSFETTVTGEICLPE